MKLSVLMSICASDCTDYIDAALSGLHAQTRQPDELVVMLDGPVSLSILSILDAWQSRFGFTTQRVELLENRGLGYALQQGILFCSYPIVARMDCDDVNHSCRFEQQLNFLEQNPDIAAVGCWMGCFEKSPNQIGFIRKMPQESKVIASIARYRNPILHPTVIFRKQAVLDAGNYPDMRRNQDYLLWAKMLLAGFQFAAIPEILYYFRTDSCFFYRRKTWGHIRSMFRLQQQFLAMGFISRFEYIRNLAIRGMVCLLPVSLFRWIRTKLIKL